MIRHGLFSALCAALLLTACGKPDLPEERFRPPEAASGATTEVIGVNEKAPATTDSLEVSSVTGVDISAVSGGVLLGDASLPMLTVYTDYECSYCREFALRDLPILEQKLMRTGRMSLRLLFVPKEESGIYPATLALCAARLGAFPAADAMLSAGSVTPKTTVVTLSKALGVDQKALTACLKRTDLAEEVKQARAEEEAKGPVRVPSFSIGGASWIGLKAQDTLLRDLESALRP